jgi:hypothetical protein
LRLIVALARCGRRTTPLADAHGLDPVVADGLHTDRIALGVDRVTALGQPAELAEDEPADRVVSVAVGRQPDVPVPERVRGLVAEGATGRKAGRGLYDYAA